MGGDSKSMLLVYTIYLSCKHIDIDIDDYIII